MCVLKNMKQSHTQLPYKEPISSNSVVMIKNTDNKKKSPIFIQDQVQVYEITVMMTC